MPKKLSKPLEPIKDTNSLNNFIEGKTITYTTFYREDVLRISNKKPLN
jgi:hypothetical protein